MLTVYSMHRMAFKPLWIALLAAVPVCAQANVTATASAQITGLTYRLIDLNTNDGIPPTITFNNVVSTSLSHGNYNSDPIYTSAAEQSAPYNGLFADTSLNTTLPSESVSVTPQGYSASASASTDEAFAHIDPANRGYEFFSVRTDAGFGVNPGLYDDLGNPVSITLSANTALIITGMAHIKGQFDKDAFVAQAAALPGAHDPFVWDYDMLNTLVELQLSTQTMELDANGNPIVSTSNYSVSQLTNAPTETNFDLSRTLSVQFANLASEDANVILGINANARANLEGSIDFRDINIDPNPPVTPPSIPEPGSFLLMGLGLVGIGLARQRARA